MLAAIVAGIGAIKAMRSMPGIRIATLGAMLAVTGNAGSQVLVPDKSDKAPGAASDSGEACGTAATSAATCGGGVLEAAASGEVE